MPCPELKDCPETPLHGPDIRGGGENLVDIAIILTSSVLVT